MRRNRKDIKVVCHIQVQDLHYTGHDAIFYGSERTLHRKGHNSDLTPHTHLNTESAGCHQRAHFMHSVFLTKTDSDYLSQTANALLLTQKNTHLFGIVVFKHPQPWKRQVWALRIFFNVNASKLSVYLALQMFDWWEYHSRVILLCVVRLDVLKGFTVHWLQSTSRCPADRLAGESLDWMSGSSPLKVRAWRENIIDFYKDRSLFSHKRYGSLRPCPVRVFVHTSALNGRIKVLSSMASAPSLSSSHLCLMSRQIGRHASECLCYNKES